MAEIKRKKNTGEPGNGGQFGSKAKSESDVGLGAVPAPEPAQVGQVERGGMYWNIGSTVGDEVELVDPVSGCSEFVNIDDLNSGAGRHGHTGDYSPYCAECGIEFDWVRAERKRLGLP